MSESGTSVVVRGGDMSVTQRARALFDEQQVALIRDTVAKDCSPAELALFLETCARHELDPIIRQIWTIKIKGKMVPVVARDGFLTIANRHTGKGWTGESGEFLGCQSNVVRGHDFFDFEQEERADGTMAFKVMHKPRDVEGNPSHGGADGSERGPIVGAWARVRRRGHDDQFFYALWDTYNKNENTWTTHPDAMIVKCAESTALRKAFSVSGVVGEGEVERSARPTLTEVSGEGSAGDGTIHWPEDEALAEQIKQGVEIVGWRRAKVRMRVNACSTEEEFKALIAEIHTEVNAMAEDGGEVSGEVVSS